MPGVQGSHKMATALKHTRTRCWHVRTASMARLRTHTNTHAHVAAASVKIAVHADTMKHTGAYTAPHSHKALAYVWAPAPATPRRQQRHAHRRAAWHACVRVQPQQRTHTQLWGRGLPLSPCPSRLLLG
jgi:hypothetical protein